MDITLNPVGVSPYEDLPEIPTVTSSNPGLRKRIDQATQTMNKMTNLHVANHTVLQEKANRLNTTLTQLDKSLKSEHPLKIQNIRWNDYFHKKYKVQTYIVSMILVACILILVAHATLPEMFPVVAGILLAVLFIYSGYLLWDLSIRDHEIFDEYHFFQHTGTLSRNKTDTDEKGDKENCIIKKMEENVKKL